MATIYVDANTRTYHIAGADSVCAGLAVIFTDDKARLKKVKAERPSHVNVNEKHMFHFANIKNHCNAVCILDTIYEQNTLLPRPCVHYLAPDATVSVPLDTDGVRYLVISTLPVSQSFFFDREVEYGASKVLCSATGTCYLLTKTETSFEGNFEWLYENRAESWTDVDTDARIAQARKSCFQKHTKHIESMGIALTEEDVIVEQPTNAVQKVFENLTADTCIIVYCASSVRPASINWVWEHGENTGILVEHAKVPFLPEVKSKDYLIDATTKQLNVLSSRQ